METAILWHTGTLIDDLEIAQVRELAALAEAADGVAPLSEQALLNLSAAPDAVVHLLTWAHRELAAYAQVDTRTCTAELVVRPTWRRRRLGYHMLVGAVLRVANPAARPEPSRPSRALHTLDRPTADLRIWAHGNLPAARALAARVGLVAQRELLLLHRPLHDVVATLPAPPAGFTLRAFCPGVDDEAWVVLNARAFAGHPEQGRLTVTDLHARMAQDWFDPRDFLLLRDDAAGKLAGFIWTKIEPGSDEGEIYVVGVDPTAQGHGLGRYLADVGLTHLTGRGMATALCYVDAANAAAVHTYERAGFTRRATDTQYGLA